jgi:COMPASS component SPP1
LEQDILFTKDETHEDLSFVHNNMLLSNIIVNNDQVVGLAGWRNSGYFGFERADKVHQQVRIPQIVSESESGIDVEGIRAWVDQYEGLQGTAQVNGLTSKHSAPAHPVKTEPSSMNLDKVPLNIETEVKPALPQLDGTDLLEEHPTPKKVASLKNRGNSRASSSDRSSPANSTKGPAKRAAPAGTKKGIGRKTASKKRKLDDQNNESTDSRRSHTPLPSRATKPPGTKKKTPASMANSPAPEGQKKGAKKAVAEEEGEEEDSEDDDAIFCICRKPDNHTWMIGCDGGCEDWFHGKCVDIDPRDADLIDKYICESYSQAILASILRQTRSKLQGKWERMDHLEANVSSGRMSEACSLQ